jgi:hypothetical protein
LETLGHDLFKYIQIKLTRDLAQQPIGFG